MTADRLGKGRPARQSNEKSPVNADPWGRVLCFGYGMSRSWRDPTSVDSPRPNVIGMVSGVASGGGAMLRKVTRRIAIGFNVRGILAGLALTICVTPAALYAAEPTIQFEIKAEPLSQALMAFGARTGTIVVASSKLTINKVSQPVTGKLSRQEALTRMLEGTGLTFEASANGTILIVRKRSAVN